MQPQSPDQPSTTPGWQYNPEPVGNQIGSQQTPAQKEAMQPITWTASEFIAHQKTTGWYGLFALASVVGIALIFLLTRDFISVVIVIVVMAVLGFAAGRKPRTLQYQLDTKGIHIGLKEYAYNDFKAFSVIEEGPINSIDLLPLKRLMPPITIYCEPKDEEHITSLLGTYLPFQEGKKDLVDRFMHRIHF